MKRAEEKSMKQAASTLILFFILLFAYTRLAGPLPFSVTSVTTQKTDTFSVTGEGKTFVTPDIAITNVGVAAQGATVKQVQEELNRRINAVSAAIKKVGIDSRDIQTSNYSIYPTYDYQAENQRITGYQASSNLTIKIRDIDRTNSVIDAATASGANQVGGVSFTVEDKTKAENEARIKAVAEAKKKAEEAARIAGFKLGRLVNYQESFGGEPRPLPLMTREAKMAGGTLTRIEPGTTEVTVQVTLSFEVK